MIKNPMIYIDDFFKYQTSINTWIRDIDLTINAGAYSAMACPLILDRGFYCRQIIEQVEVAYIIYKQCGLKKQSDPLSFYKTKEDYFNYTRLRNHGFNGEIDPADTLSKFFSFQSLSKWYSTLDDIMVYLTNAENSSYDRFGDKIVAIKELLFRLAYALHNIYMNGGIPVPVCSYFIAQPAEVFVGKMPRSKLGKLIDSLIDKQREKLAKELEGEEEQHEK